MFAMPLVYTQQLVADRQRSYEATASRRRMRRQARQQADDLAAVTRRPDRAPVVMPVAAPIIRHAAIARDAAARPTTAASKVA